jgi:hypothetical protein
MIPDEILRLLAGNQSLRAAVSALFYGMYF